MDKIDEQKQGMTEKEWAARQAEEAETERRVAELGDALAGRFLVRRFNVGSRIEVGNSKGQGQTPNEMRTKDKEVL